MDLFDHPNLIPDSVSDIIESYNCDECLYAETERILSEMEKIGYTFEYGLDGTPFNLRKITRS